MSSMYGTIAPARTESQQPSAINRYQRRRKLGDWGITLAHLKTAHERHSRSIKAQNYHPLRDPLCSSTASSPVSSESSEGPSSFCLPSKAYLDFDVESRYDSNEDHYDSWTYDDDTLSENRWERRVVQLLCFFILVLMATGVAYIIFMAVQKDTYHTGKRP